MKKTEKTYHENGSVHVESELNEKGESHGITRLYHENGQLQAEINFSNGIQDDGELISYHNDGSKARQVTLVNHLMNGPYYEWHRNGQLKTEGIYYDKVPTVLKEWEENGVLINEIDNSSDNGLFKEVSGKEKMKVNWLQDIGPIYPADDYIPHVLLHNPKTENDGEYIMLLCNNKEEAIAIIDHIIELNGGKDKFFKQEIEDWSHVFSGHLFYIRYRNELFGDYVIVELNRREERKFVSFNDKNEILHGIHKDSKKINSMIYGLNSIVYNSGEMTSGGGHLYYTASESHIVSYWDDLEKAINKFKSIVDCYSENAISENLIGSHKEILDFTYENLKGIINKKDFFLSLKTDEFTINLSKGTSSYQMNFYLN
jgi:hypothetical protein